MPPTTLAAFRDHGVAHDRLTGSGREVQATFDELVAAGVEIDAVTNRLLKDGIGGFAASMDECSPSSAPSATACRHRLG
jgi:transaldolase/glucose-6-phosphate isomerase